MTNAEVESAWNEIVALAKTAFRQAESGGTPDRDVSGALAERVIAFNNLRQETTVDLEEVDDG